MNISFFVIALIISSDYRRIKYDSQSFSKFQGKKNHASLWFRWGSIFFIIHWRYTFQTGEQFFHNSFNWSLSINYNCIFFWHSTYFLFLFLFIFSVFLFISIHIFHTPYSKNVGKTRSRIRVRNAMIFIDVPIKYWNDIDKRKEKEK